MKHWRTYLKYTITLALTCVVVGGALGAVNYVTDPIISARKLGKPSAMWARPPSAAPRA